MTVTVAALSAPSAPGALGTAIEATAAMAYLDALGRWRDDRRRELDQLDAAALSAPEGAGLTGDIMLSMALWKAVSDRYELLMATWDSGRVGPAERERMSSLIWGRLDATIDPSLLTKGSATTDLTGLAVSLPEAGLLLDALVGQLRVRLALDTDGQEVAERLRQLRAQLERIRDQGKLEADLASRQRAAQQQAELVARVQEVTAKAGRGADVGGLLGPLEIDASKLERDLIVNAATRRETESRAEQARILRADLVVRAGALQQLVAQCIDSVDSSPKYAVPDVGALGPLPTTATLLDGYLARLQQVSRAMTVAQEAYAKAISDREELVGRLEAYRVKGDAIGVSTSPDVAQVYELAQAELRRRPTRMTIANQLVTLYQSYLQRSTSQRDPSGSSPATGSAPANRSTRETP